MMGQRKIHNRVKRSWCARGKAMRQSLAGSVNTRDMGDHTEVRHVRCRTLEGAATENTVVLREMPSITGSVSRYL
jgi:hypothetical protein